MPARRKSPRRSKSRSKSPRRSLKRRSSGKARKSRRVTRRSPKCRTYKGTDTRLYGIAETSNWSKVRNSIPHDKWKDVLNGAQSTLNEVTSLMSKHDDGWYEDWIKCDPNFEEKWGVKIANVSPTPEITDSRRQVLHHMTSLSRGLNSERAILLNKIPSALHEEMFRDYAAGPPSKFNKKYQQYLADYTVTGIPEASHAEIAVQLEQIIPSINTSDVYNAIYQAISTGTKVLAYVILGAVLGVVFAHLLLIGPVLASFGSLAGYQLFALAGAVSLPLEMRYA